MTIIPDLSDLVLEQVSITNEVTITVHATSPAAPCPCCGIISKRIQSRSTRTLRDLPASGRPVHLILHVRRFFCQESTCVRKIFAERFPSQKHALPPDLRARMEREARAGEFKMDQAKAQSEQELQRLLGNPAPVPGTAPTTTHHANGASAPKASPETHQGTHSQTRVERAAA